MAPHSSLTNRALRLATLRIGAVAVCAGLASYYLNLASLETAVRSQLRLSTSQTLERESLAFGEIRRLEQNFLQDFRAQEQTAEQRARLAGDFDAIFLRHPDGSWTQRPGLFEGQPLADGRRFARMSATYAPDIPPDEDVKARFALSYQLSYKYGSAARGRLFNFYGVVPEKGFPIYQDADIAQVFHYSGPDALRLETYEFYARGFASPAHETFYTRMYYDYSNKAWMTTVATPDEVDSSGRHRIMACVDVLLDELMQRLSTPAIAGAYSVLFVPDQSGTLIFHPQQMQAIQSSEGQASLQSLQLPDAASVLQAGHALRPGEVRLLDTPDEIIALGQLPETPWVLGIHYPRALMQPSVMQNLAIVVALGLLTLLVEIFVLRTILQNQVARPLAQLIRATRLLGASSGPLKDQELPTQSQDEVGELARDFACMAQRVQQAHEQLEARVQERTRELAEANHSLAVLSTTDELTGLANRRHFNALLLQSWQQVQQTGQCLALGILDIDWFKQYNDRYGHQAGDACLQNVARLLAAHRDRTGNQVARYGGEEFAWIAITTTTEQAMAAARELHASFAQARLPHIGSPLGCVTVSMGVASLLPPTDMDLATLLKQADAELYRAKEQGRNRVVMVGE